MILSDKSLKTINKHINHDLKLLKTYLRANRISLNANKTEINLLRTKSQANKTKHLNFRLSGQRVERINEVKYVGLVVNEFLKWRNHFTHLKKKLNRAISLFSKNRHHTSQNLLKSIYVLLFNSHLIYGSQIWAKSIAMDSKKYENFKRKQ